MADENVFRELKKKLEEALKDPTFTDRLIKGLAAYERRGKEGSL